MQNQPTILIFDDDAELLELCSVILKKKGFTVHTSEDCMNLLEKLKAVEPALVLMDNWIPDIGGVEATRRIKADARFGHVPVVFFSANNDVPTLAAAAGADAYITKPFNISDLEDTIVRMLQQGATAQER